MAAKLSAGLVVWFTHLSVRFYGFVREPFNRERFLRLGARCMLSVALAFVLLTGFLAIYREGGFGAVWAQWLAWECAQMGRDIALCMVDGPWWKGSLLGIGFVTVIMWLIVDALLYPSEKS